MTNKTTELAAKSLLLETNKSIAHRGIRIISLDPNKPKTAPCHMFCDKHGDGNDWGTPWKTHVSSLLKGLGCPKCSGLYKRAESELWEHLSSIPAKGGVEIIPTPYFDGMKSRYGIVCPTHGKSDSWDKPFLRLASSIQVSNIIKCPKCEGTYLNTLEEKKNELNNIMKKEGFTLLDWVGGVYKDQLTRCYVSCDIHGDGNDWGTPWTPTYGTLMAGNRCPKCAKNYIPSKEEYLNNVRSIIKRDQQPGHDILHVKGFVGEYKNIHSILNIECEKHGVVLTRKGAHPALKKTLSQGVACSYCRKGTSPDAHPHLSSKDTSKKTKRKNKNVQVANDARPPTALSNKTNIRVARNQGETPLNGHSLPKKQLKHLKNIGLTLAGWVDVEYNGRGTECLVSCHKHGNCWEWVTPWFPRYQYLPDLLGCAKCTSSYSPSKEERISEMEAIFNVQKENETLIDTNVTHSNVSFVGFQDYSSNQAKTTCKLHCDIHGNLWKFGKPQLPLLSTIKQYGGVGCAKCLRIYKPTDAELIDSLNEKLASHKCHVISLKPGTSLHRKVQIHCDKHGDADLWDNPWNPTANSILRTKNEHVKQGCPKCIGWYRPSYEEVEKDLFSAAEEDGVSYHGLLDEKYNNFSSAKAKLSCDKHGNGWEWYKPWTPTVHSYLKSTKKCPKCLKRKSQSPDDRIAIANEVLKDKGISIVGIHGEFKGAFSKTKANCKIHGNGWEWSTPWTPTFDNIRGGKGCPKCSGRYKETESELVEKATTSLAKQGNKFHGFLSNFKGVVTKCDVSCQFHGRGVDMKPKWTPEIRQIINNTGMCRICVSNMGSLNTYLSSIEKGEPAQQRTLYYIAFKHGDKVFYKIGLATSQGGVEGRYKPYNLDYDGVEIIWYKEVSLDNGLAILLEAGVLSYFNKDRYFGAINILKSSNGGTECFSENILASINFKNILVYAVNNYNVLREERLYGENLTSCPKIKLSTFLDNHIDNMPERFPDEYYQYNSFRRIKHDIKLPEQTSLLTDTTIDPIDIKLKPRKRVQTKSKPRIRKKKVIDDLSALETLHVPNPCCSGLDKNPKPRRSVEACTVQNEEPASLDHENQQLNMEFERESVSNVDETESQGKRFYSAIQNMTRNSFIFLSLKFSNIIFKLKKHSSVRG
jgi:hypothetical protein